MSRIIDAERFDVFMDKVPDGMDANSFIAGQMGVLRKIDEAITICCENCKYATEVERIGDLEFVYCIKPHAGMTLKDWFCGDWRKKDDE